MSRLLVLQFFTLVSNEENMQKVICPKPQNKVCKRYGKASCCFLAVCRGKVDNKV